MHFPTFVTALSCLLSLTSAVVEPAKEPIDPQHSLERGCCDTGHKGAWQNDATTKCCAADNVHGEAWHHDKPDGGRMSCTHNDKHKKHFMHCCISKGWDLEQEGFRACRLV
ncbi:hypothetical protein EG328_001686 [Venturia inaequalis]|uniref:Uncharacterized protein n=1 Tax=Venturia inaequalis TaxID=5025 RepID=A0A8H3UZ33_VENIN|nr:hypothetical protein EG328_001686 [Venturia inaequalis]